MSAPHLTEAEKSRFLTLKPAIAIKHHDTLIGTIVNDVTEPRNSYRPALNPHTRDLLQGIYSRDDSVNLLDIATEGSYKTDTRVSSRLTELFSAYAVKGTAKVKAIKAASGHRYQLDNAPDAFERLWADDEYRAQIMMLVEDKRRNNKLEKARDTKHRGEVIKLPMVTSFITCSHVTAELENGKEVKIGARGTVPVGKIAGGVNDGGALDVSAEAAHENVSSDKAGATINDEVIIAAAYDWIAIPQCKRSPKSANGGSGKDDGRPLKFLNNLNLFRRSSGDKCPQCERDGKDYHQAWVWKPIHWSSPHAFNNTLGASPKDNGQEALEHNGQGYTTADTVPVFSMQESEEADVIYDDDLRLSPQQSEGCTQNSRSDSYLGRI